MPLYILGIGANHTLMHEVITLDAAQVRVPVARMYANYIYFEADAYDPPVETAKKWALTQFPSEQGWGYQIWSAVAIAESIICNDTISYGVIGATKYTRLLDETTTDIALMGRRNQSLEVFSGRGDVEHVRTHVCNLAARKYPRTEGFHSYVKVHPLPHTYNRRMAVEEHSALERNRSDILRDLSYDSAGVVVRLPKQNRRR